MRTIATLAGLLGLTVHCISGEVVGSTGSMIRVGLVSKSGVFPNSFGVKGSQAVRRTPRPERFSQRNAFSRGSLVRADIGGKMEDRNADAPNPLGGNMVSQNSYDEWARVEKEKGRKSYEALKKKLIQDTSYVAIAIVVYFAINGVSYIDILTSVLGGASSILYLLLLIRDIDRISPDDPTPMLDLKDYEGPLKWPLKISTAYSYAIRPRILVPVGLAVLLTALDRMGLDIPLSARGTAVGAFLAFNGALIGAAIESFLGLVAKEDKL
ncbi:hypothetical protein AAMO2058_001573500 [Amorphochlora amoebiformis]